MIAVYVTKYALSEGVFKLNGKTWGGDGKYFREVNDETTGRGLFLTIGNDCFVSRSDAVIRVESMRLRKIESLRKQIAKLEKLNAEEMVP